VATAGSRGGGLLLLAVRAAQGKIVVSLTRRGTPSFHIFPNYLR
jgi:hypothetical protein